MLKPGHNCWRIERAQRAAVIVDAADYFRLARHAMLKARSQILLIGWDFDTRIPLDPDANDGAPAQLGAFLSWLVKKSPNLHIHILKWDVGTIAVLGRGSTLFRLARWAASPNITFKLDGAHPMGASHHQKIVVIDDKLAFCGGIDMTAERWDTREHRDLDPRRKRPTTGRKYEPWHDATMAVDGAAAKAIGELARTRWQIAGGKPIEPPAPGPDTPWPSALEPMFREVDVAISRTRGAHADVPPLREIEALFLDQIKRAKRFVYAENQYFSSRAIAQAIQQRMSQPGCPNFVIVNARTSQGWLDDEAMTPARTKLVKALRHSDAHGCFRIYSPVTAGGEDIYVHSKILIVDDELIRVGSANFNNRSMGLDSECDLTIDTALEANRSAAKPIARMLDDLLGEHLGIEPEVFRREFERSGSLIDTVEKLRGGPGRTLIPLELDEPNTLEETLAENEALDPESAGEVYEPMARPGLMARIRR